VRRHQRGDQAAGNDDEREPQPVETLAQDVEPLAQEVEPILNPVGAVGNFRPQVAELLVYTLESQSTRRLRSSSLSSLQLCLIASMMAQP
jgi:hypothetical protein